MSPTLNSVLYLLLCCGLGALALGLLHFDFGGSFGREKREAAMGDNIAVEEIDSSDLRRLLAWIYAVMGSAWGLSYLPVDRIGLKVPSWYVYAGAVAVFVGFLFEVMRRDSAKEGEKSTRSTGLLYLAVAGFWAFKHAHELLGGRL